MTVILATFALLLAGADPKVLTLEASASTVRYHVNHALHTVDGVSRAAEGKVLIDPDGTVKTMVRIPVQSFDSGDSNRDSHMLETLQAGKFPNVIFKGVGKVPPAAPGTRPASVVLHGELDFHGVKRPVELPVTVEFGGNGAAHVRGTLAVSLEAHHVERPSMLAIKLDDECTIAFDLKLGRSR